ncbi:MAG: hypothetical protein JRD68_00230 [Deltaproteobacteria bacterium]|nr:hypothetical protein [Deltaproteobacteria bacterium]
MKLYKLTDEKHQTHNKCQWGESITHSVDKGLRNIELCSFGVIHAYKNQNLALLLNPIHANIDNPELWEASGEVEVEDWGKVGCHELTTIEKLDLPNWYTDEEIRKKIFIQFSILCAESVLSIFENEFPDDKRPRETIEAAREYLKNPAWSVAWFAAWSAAWFAAWSAARSAAESATRSATRSAAWSAAKSAARSATRSAAKSAAWSAAESAAESATRSAAKSAAWSAAWSATRSAAWSATESAARSAARSAESAAWSAAESAESAEINFCKLADKATKDIPK